MSPAAVTVFGKDGRRIRHASARFALLLWNFGGISVSFVLPDNDSGSDPKARAATLALLATASLR